MTLGIKEANAGGPAAQKLDKLGIRVIVVDGAAAEGKFYSLKISKDEAILSPADEYKGLKNYRLVKELYKKYKGKPAIISIGTAGERKYKSASVSCTDIFGDPSRNAGRGGLGAVMGSKGLKAIIIDDASTPPIDIANKAEFKKTVKSWVDTLNKDVACQLFSTFGTHFVIASNSYQGTMPADNYASGRPEGFMKVSREVIKQNVRGRGGKMHGCMPGCVVQCSIIYNDAEGKHLASAYEYEGVAMLGTNLGITDLDAIARLKFICDDLGIDLIEMGSSLGVAASAGRMKMGNVESAIKLLKEVEEGTDLGYVLANGVVSTAKALNVNRVPAFKGQAIPGHDPRAVKGVGVAYATNPMGADHTAGMIYRIPLQKTGQIANSLRFQIQAAVCDTLGYCINSIPGGQASLYAFLADLLSARYGVNLTDDDVLKIGKQTLKDELKFNEGAEFSKIHERYPAFVRTEALPPTNNVFDVEDSELDRIWDKLDTFREPPKIWEVRFPPMPSILFGAGVIRRLGEQARALNIKKALLLADPVMKSLGRVDELQGILERSGIDSVVFTDIEPDPPVEEVEKAGQLYREQLCDGIIGVGGGSSMDAAKGVAVRVSQTGVLTEYEGAVGGTAKMKPPLPPIICIPTTSGTGSEVDRYASITDKHNENKFLIVSDLIVPKLAVVDPDICRTMPPGLTAETGIDALAHCVESYVSLTTPYHPFYEALALYGVKLIGRSLRRAYTNGEDIDARVDMCMAAINGGIAFSKGLGIGHAIAHSLGSLHHVPHGKACVVGLLCFIRASREACRKDFSDLAWALDGSDDLELALVKLFKDLDVATRLRDFGIQEKDLKGIAFKTAQDVFNLAGNPTRVGEQHILALLRENLE